VPVTEKYKGVLIFLIITISCIFLSGNDLLEEFSSRVNYVRFNWRLLGLLATSDIIFLIGFSILAVFFFKLYLFHLKAKTSYRNVFWYCGGIFLGISLLTVLRIIGYFVMYMWIYAACSLFVSWFVVLVVVEFYTIYKDLKNPQFLPDSKKEFYQKMDERWEKIKELFND